MSDYIECPTCKKNMTPTGDESDGDDIICDDCGCEFRVYVSEIIVYSTECREHDWREVHEYRFRTCRRCGKTELLCDEANE